MNKLSSEVQDEECYSAECAYRLEHVCGKQSPSPSVSAWQHHKNCAIWTVTTDGAKKDCDCAQADSVFKGSPSVPEAENKDSSEAGKPHRASPSSESAIIPKLDAARYQRRLYDECVTAGWDATKQNTFAEEIAHLHEELSEAFRAFRRYKDFEVREVNGKLEGIPIEFADVLIGLFYNAELHGFDLFAAVEQKHQFNLKRNYVAEGRQLHGSEFDFHCPGCSTLITPDNAGGYRAYCERCVKAMPSLPQRGAYELQGTYPNFRWVTHNVPERETESVQD